tara:strand:+ start:536 stop:886 length:351 start_codon:yes stop_codon:yes gene_type:complete
MAIEKIPLSGSTDGKMIQCTGNNTTLHTASSNASHIDEVWIWAMNIHTADEEVTIGWGQAGYTVSNSLFTVPTEAGLYLLVPGLILKGNAGTQKLVNGYCSAVDRINFAGYVNRHS